MTEAELFKFLASQKLGVLGTITPDGSPQSALIGIAVVESLGIVFDTLTTSRKYRNLLANPAASLVVGWESEVTVQYEGVARELTGPERTPYLDEYFAVWPECKSHLQWPDIAHFLIRPQWIRHSDYAQEPPMIQEFRYATSL